MTEQTIPAVLPVNPYETTGKTGIGRMRALGENRAADAIVIARTSGAHGGWPWLLMIERGDGHGWAVPGGHVDPGEDPVAAAVRELAEETGLVANPDDPWTTVLPTRYVPDPRATDNAWMVTTPVRIDWGMVGEILPDVVGQDDARRAAWIGAVDYDCVVRHLADAYGGEVFAAHRQLLVDVLDGGAR